MALAIPLKELHVPYNILSYFEGHRELPYFKQNKNLEIIIVCQSRQTPNTVGKNKPKWDIDG